MEAARNRLAELELEYGIEKAKVDSVRSRLFAALRTLLQERDRLRLLLRFRKAFIARLLAEGEEAAEASAGDLQRETAEKDREYTTPPTLPWRASGNSTTTKRPVSNSYGKSWCACSTHGWGQSKRIDIIFK